MKDPTIKKKIVEQEKNFLSKKNLLGKKIIS